jgi:hypothetical protein
MPSPDMRPLADRLTVSRSIAVGAAVVAGIAVVTAMILWIHYGTAVFYETIAAGIAACL